MKRAIKALTNAQSKKRVAYLRARGYEVKLVPFEGGVIVLRRKKRRSTKHRSSR